MNGVIYLLVTFSATFFGSLAGIGGGILIKPLLDFMGDYPLETINLLSSFAVFTMALVNSFKNRYMLKQLNVKIVGILAISSFLGGIYGKKSFELLINSQNVSMTIVGNIQSLLIIIVMVIVVLLTLNQQRFNGNSNPKLIFPFIAGLGLGIISAFLAIGGGPLNVIILIILWNFSAKEAAVSSIIMILFAQTSSLLQTLSQTSINDYDLTMLPFMIFGAVIGGLIGSQAMKKITDKQVTKLNIILTITIIGINLINILN